MVFPSAEHAYQYTRAMRFKKTGLAKMITMAKSGKAAKQLGSQIESNDTWDKVKIDIKRTIITEKFMQNPALCDKLVGSGQTNLIEATLDGFWGARATPTSKSLKQGTWTGANFLGKILAETRTELRRELGLPTLSVPNATEPTPMDQGTQVVTSTPATPAATAAQASNANQQTTSQPTSGNNKSPAEQNTGSQTERTSRKNKEHQSPIPSPGKSAGTQQTNRKKKARVFSPKSELPPKSSIGDLFLVPLDEDLAGEAASA